MLISALIFNMVLPICLLQGFSPRCFAPKQPDFPTWPNLVFSSSKPAPSPLPTPAPVLTPKPTLSPTPIATSKPTPSPAPVPASGGQTDSFLEQINNYRRLQGLSPVQSDPNVCSFAKVRAQEIVNGFNHDGFNNRVSGKTLPYRSYTQVTENLARNSNPGDVVNQWINSPAHAANLRSNTPFACVQSSGNYYAFEGWNP